MRTFKNQNLLYLIIILFVFLLQPIKTGFEKGHHGWVSADGLSIISRANYGHQFVGIIGENIDKNGKKQFHYFDRYPFFFSATFNALLKPFEWNYSNYIMAGRYLMNIIFIFSLLVAFKLLLYFFEDKKKALACALVVFSGHFFIHYKDMVHFDQPAILGNLIILLMIAKYKTENKFKPLLIASIFVPLWGRGYSSNFLLLTWNIIEFIFLLKQKEAGTFFSKILTHLKSRTFIVLVASVPLTASFLAYNVYIEAKVRDVSITETSIFQSAKRRLGAKTLQNRQEKKAEFKRFIPKQIDRKKDLFTPEFFSILDTSHVDRKDGGPAYYLKRLPAELFGILVIIFFFMNIRGYYRELKLNQKIILLTSIFSGFVWCYTMRKLTTYHNYTTMYYVGFSLMLYTTIFKTKFKNTSSNKLLYTTLTLFVLSLAANLYKIYPLLDKINHQGNDFTLIRESLDKMESPVIYFDNSNNPVINSPKFIYGSPFAHHFYTTGYFVGLTPEVSNVIIEWKNGKIQIKDSK